VTWWGHGVSAQTWSTIQCWGSGGGAKPSSLAHCTALAIRLLFEGIARMELSGKTSSSQSMDTAALETRQKCKAQSGHTILFCHLGKGSNYFPTLAGEIFLVTNSFNTHWACHQNIWSDVPLGLLGEPPSLRMAKPALPSFYSHCMFAFSHTNTFWRSNHIIEKVRKAVLCWHC
jgi:hypothetical protein